MGSYSTSGTSEYSDRARVPVLFCHDLDSIFRRSVCVLFWNHVTLNAVGVSIWRFQICDKLWATTKPQHFNQRNNTCTHFHSPATCAGCLKIQVRGPKHRLSHLAGWDVAETASVRCSFPAAQPFNGREPTLDGQILVFFIPCSTWPEGFAFPPPPCLPPLPPNCSCAHYLCRIDVFFS